MNTGNASDKEDRQSEYMEELNGGKKRFSCSRCKTEHAPTNKATYLVRCPGYH